MGYLEKTLSAGEGIRYKARTHWIVYATPIFGIVLWTLIGAFFPLAFILTFFNFVALILNWTTAATSDLAVTSKKIVAKWGLISRRTIEQRLDKVESIRVEQSLLGRMFNFGNITVVGSGATGTPIPNIADPITFRRMVEEAIDQPKQSA